MENYILLSTLNDFIFCPYSIYIHNIYNTNEEDINYAAPQKKGKAAHSSIDEKKYSSSKNDIVGLSVYSDEFKIMGKIDLYKSDEKFLVERKYQIKQIYQGQIYQIWGQYFCMLEMNYDVEKLAFYEISTNKMHPIDKPNSNDKEKFRQFIVEYINYNPETEISINENKCNYCIYCNLCDKTTVYNNLYD